jgi:hypothetical protein
MEIPGKNLPSDNTLPEDSILNKSDYEKILGVATDEELSEFLSRANGEKIRDGLGRGKCRVLSQSGLAHYKFDTKGKYLELTYIAEVVLEADSPEDAVRKLIDDEKQYNPE